MEKLIPINELCQADGRNILFLKYSDDMCEYRPFTLNDIYGIASVHFIHDGVPDEVRNTYAIAQNLYAYSWFYYPFNAEAGFIALRATERALAIRMGLQKKRLGLKSLVSEAIKRDLLSEDEYTITCRCKDTANLPDEEENADAGCNQSTYLEMLPDILSGLRNSPAHGESFIHPQGSIMLRLAAETINQLFKKLDNPDNTIEISIEE